MFGRGIPWSQTVNVTVAPARLILCSQSLSFRTRGFRDLDMEIILKEDPLTHTKAVPGEGVGRDEPTH